MVNTIHLKASPVFQKNLDAFNNPKIKIIVNQGGTRCFYPKQEVITSKGSIPIESVKKGDLCLTFYKGEYKYHKVIDKLIYKNIKPTLEVILKNGHKIISTEDHKFFYKGGWHTLKCLVELSYGRMETNTRIQKIRSIKHRSYKVNELQELEEDSSVVSVHIKRLIRKLENCIGKESHICSSSWDINFLCKPDWFAII